MLCFDIVYIFSFKLKSTDHVRDMSSKEYIDEVGDGCEYRYDACI